MVGAIGFEFAFHEIGSGTLPDVAPGGDGEATPTADAADAVLAHERRHALAAHDQPLIHQLGARTRDMPQV